MKRLFLFGLLLIILSTVQAQTDTSKYVTNTNTEKLIDKYSTKIEASIIALAQQLKQPAEHIYGIIVKQQVVKGVASLLFILISVFFVIFSTYKLNRHNKKYKKYDSNSDPEGWVVLIVISGICFFGSLVWFFNSGLGNLINPEYGALQDIIDFIK